MRLVQHPKLVEIRLLWQCKIGGLGADHIGGLGADHILVRGHRH